MLGAVTARKYHYACIGDPTGVVMRELETIHRTRVFKDIYFRPHVQYLTVTSLKDN